METIPASASPRFVEAMAKIEKAKKRVFYKRLGSAVLAATLLATTPAAAKAVRKDQTSISVSGENDDESPIMVVSTVPSIEEAITKSAPTLVEEEASTSPSIDVEALEFSSEPEISTNIETDTREISKSWDGPVLNAYDGHIDGPTGDETFYNLPMDEIVARMHRMGIKGEYWEREDGVKMLGDYVMVAADLKVHPRGSIVETSLGPGIVCDTGGFAKTNHNRLDIATNWEDPRDKNLK